MKKQDVKHGEAYKLIKQLWDNSDRGSWQRLNGSLHQVLSAAILGHLSFEIDDFNAIHDNFRGGYWMGNGTDTCGEGFYNLAIEANHLPASLAFEHYAERPPALWAENTKTPIRMCIGSQFTWEGLIVTVTSLRKTDLIACSYKADENRHDRDIREGQTSYFWNGYREIQELKQHENGGLSLKLGPTIVAPKTRSIDRRFTITYEELKAKRKAYDQNRKALIRSINEAESREALKAISETVTAAGRRAYRHFDLDEINKAYSEKLRSFGPDAQEERRRTAEALERWRNGGHREFFEAVRLRVYQGHVETSTGMRASVESVRALLPWALKHRKKPGPVKDKFVDLHRIERFTAVGVQVGCTLIPWEEVEALPALLEVHGQK